MKTNIIFPVSFSPILRLSVMKAIAEENLQKDEAEQFVFEVEEKIAIMIEGGVEEGKAEGLAFVDILQKYRKKEEK